jgi:mono/diheme cytochrome c family protein
MMHDVRILPASTFLILLALPNSNLLADGSKSGDVAPSSRPSGASRNLFESSVRPFLAKHCIECHGETKPKGGVNLIPLQDEARAPQSRKLWSKVKENVEGTLMPPEGHPQPSQEEIESLSKWIETELNRADCGRTVDPGRVTIRRLNRSEYNNTIRDLFGIDLKPADDFPSDDVGYGFDNIGDVLSIPPLLMEKYLTAAEFVAEHAIVVGSSTKPAVKAWDLQALDASAGGNPHGDEGRLLSSNGEVVVRHTPPRAGNYVLRVHASGQQAGPEPVRMALLVDGQVVKTADVRAVEGDPMVVEVRRKLKDGEHSFAAAFLNDYYQPEAKNPADRDRNLVVEGMELEGPLHEAGEALPESHRRIIFRTPKKPEEFSECAAEVLRKFASRAYRRPVTGGELGKLLRFVDLARENGDSFERGIQLAVQAALVAPEFLFRVELNRGRRRRSNNDSPGVPLNDFEVASRLSYFLWSSMPDDELFRLALDNKLHEPGTLEKQVHRMLRDPKAQALVDNFAGQWLQLRNLKLMAPDRERFPAFDEPLREAMQKESELFFASVMREDRSILDFIDCEYTYLNERLARHYGIKGVQGDRFRRVRVPDGRRGGLITQASILTVTSNSTRTSPVKRGKWVLEEILGAPPPPAPPNVPKLADDTEQPLSGTLRQRMEQHRANASCASCHQRLDPLGFGLENYDPIGAWRDRDGAEPVDASGTLPSGESFQGPAALKAILKTRQREFTRCLAEKMTTYALGRGLEDYDGCTIDRVIEGVAAGKYRFSRLVIEVVRSDAFLKRRG